MLLWLFEQLAGYHSSFQVVRYLTLRSLLSVLTALSIGLVLGPVMIRKLQALKYGQAVSTFAPENHAKKMGTPTMGGVLILLSIGISTLLWADLSNPYVWIVLGVMVIFGADMGPFEAALSSGANRVQAFWVAIMPQLWGQYISLALYNFEMNIRNAAVLGYVGAGGIGIVLNERLGWRVYEDVGLILLVMMITVYLIESTSRLIRTKLL
jgi:ABC-type amino acid transport system permease subunit